MHLAVKQSPCIIRFLGPRPRSRAFGICWDNFCWYALTAKLSQGGLVADTGTSAEWVRTIGRTMCSTNNHIKRLPILDIRPLSTAPWRLSYLPRCHTSRYKICCRDCPSTYVMPWIEGPSWLEMEGGCSRDCFFLFFILGNWPVFDLA